MKVIVLLFICLLSVSQAKTSPAPRDQILRLSFNDIMEIIGGVFVGMGSDINAKDIQPCIVDDAAIGDNLELALKYFLEKTYSGKVEAMAKLGEAYKELPGAIKSCVPASEEFARAIEEMVLAFAHPLSVLYHMGENLIVNGQDILADVSYAMGAYEYHQYYEFGYYCGAAGFKILYIPSNAEVTNSAVNEIANGIIKATNLPQQNCLTESLVGGFFMSAFNHEESFGGFADGLLSLGNGIEKLFQDIETCSGKSYLAGLQSAIQAMQNPTSLAYSKYMHLLNGVDLSNFKVVKVNYMNQDWENVGYYIGKMINQLTQ